MDVGGGDTDPLGDGRVVGGPANSSVGRGAEPQEPTELVVGVGGAVHVVNDSRGRVRVQATRDRGR